MASSKRRESKFEKELDALDRSISSQHLGADGDISSLEDQV